MHVTPICSAQNVASLRSIPRLVRHQSTHVFHGSLERPSLSLSRQVSVMHLRTG